MKKTPEELEQEWDKMMKPFEKSDSESCSAMGDLTADIRNKLTPALTLAEITTDPKKRELCQQVKIGIDHILTKLKELEQSI